MRELLKRVEFGNYVLELVDYGRVIQIDFYAYISDSAYILESLKGISENGVKKLEKYFKDIIQPTHLRIITAYAERLNISYKYIIGKVDYYLSHKKEIGGSVPMLASWFKFDYRAMSLYLSENSNFGSI